MGFISLRSILFIFCCFFVALSCKDTADVIEIAVNGESDYQIVVGSSDRKSAEILQEYVEKLSGAKLPIVNIDDEFDDNNPKFYVTTTEGDDKGREIRIKTKGNDFFITGGSQKYTEYAVYEFLEKFFDCRWYTPEVEVVPMYKVMAAYELDYTYIPKIETRTVHSRLFYDNHDFADKQKVTYEGFPNYVPGAGVHTFHKFLPEENFYKSNPEYYALRGDKRLPTQLCLTNQKTLEIVKDSVAALFKRHPERTVISVSQDDNQQYCQCGNCAKIDAEEGSPSGTMIRFVNEVAAEFPDKTISTLAYQYTRKPCKTRPADNVLITLCSIECDRSDPIEKNCTDFADDLKGWGQLTNNIRIWDYTTQFTNFLAPFPNLHTLQPNLKLFRDNNAKWVFEQHSRHPSELFELRSYITAKLLWNPDLDFEKLITDFTNGYYKEAGVYVKNYIDLIHSKIKEDDDFFLFLYGDPSQAFNSFLDKDLLLEYDKLFDDAEKVVETGGNFEALWRVKMARVGIDYAILEACRKNLSDTFCLLKKDTNGNVITNPLVEKKLENFKLICIKNDISLMNEMGYEAIAYYFNYKKTIEVAKKPNKAIGKNVITLTKPKKYANEDPMVLTDGALGGSSFYANWLGYEGNDMEVVLDLGEPQELNSVSTAFLQVTNHIVFFPKNVTYYGSIDNKKFIKLGIVNNPKPLQKKSKVNDIENFGLKFKTQKFRYIKVSAKNVKTPYWHHAAGLPSWIFADEIIVD